MNKLLLLLLTIMTVAHCHIYRDHWMRKNNIDPDYMHYKAMSGRSRAAVVLEKVKQDKLSAQEIDFSTELTMKLLNVQRFSYGFLNGTSTVGSSIICTSAMVNLIDASFDLINYRFVWLPEYTIKYNQAQSRVSDYSNTSYAYCNFAQLVAAIQELFDSGSTTALGRMFSRIGSAMTYNWWYKTNCIIDGVLGRNYYDIGYCTG